MGITYIELEVANVAAPKKGQKLEFLVDSGAVYSVVPARVLRKLGIKPIDKQEFRLANGEKIVRRKGGALFRYDKHVGGSDVIFGEARDATLLGSLTLTALGLFFHPLKRELREIPLMLA